MIIFNILLLLAGLASAFCSGFCVSKENYGTAISYGLLAILDIILAFLS
jgi:hypothetical protein